MFQDLDSTLTELLPVEDPNATSFLFLRAADKSFLTPDKTFNPQNNTLNLFLYDVKENRELRDPTPLIEKVGATFIRKSPPVRVDCSYIVTAWSNAIADAKVRSEHQLLAEALQWLSGFPTIPRTKLQGGLASAIYLPPLMVAQMDPNKNAGDFWIALGIPPRPAFYLSVTVEMTLDAVAQGPLVTTHSTGTATADNSSDSDWVQVGGQIRTLAGTAIGGAAVELVELGLRTTSQDDGRYSFLRVPAGDHTLSTVAVGFVPPPPKHLTVPGRPEDYDVTLTPL